MTVDLFTNASEEEVMSDEFVQLFGEEDKKKTRTLHRLGLPVSETNYHKSSIECLFNLLGGFVQNLRKTTIHGERKTENDIPIECVHLLIEISRLTGYMINSTSWNQGKMEKYDYDEIVHRLQRCEDYFSGEYRRWERMKK